MKVQSIFDLVQDSRDLTDFFTNVETPEQMVSRLERIKKGEAEEFLIAIESLRMANENILSDMLEVGGSLSEADDFDDSTLDDLGRDAPASPLAPLPTSPIIPSTEEPR